MRNGVEAIRAGDGAAVVGLCHEGAVAVEVVGGLAGLSFTDGLGDSSPEGVVAVADGGAGSAGRALADFAQALGSVVAVCALPGGAAFLLSVALGGVADAGWLGGAARDAGIDGARVLGELVVGVVDPGSRLVGTAGAVAGCVVAILFAGQAFELQHVVRGGLGQTVEMVVGILEFE